MRSAYLTTSEVAQRENLTTYQVATFCRMGFIFPIMKHNRSWLIGREYAFVANIALPRRKQISIGQLGRPKGSRNVRPYPKGVKRPRRKNMGNFSHKPERATRA